MKRKISILGSTGSIGVSTLDVLTHHSDLFDVYALTGGHNAACMIEQVRAFSPKYCVMADVKAAQQVRDACSDLPVEVRDGAAAIVELGAEPHVDVVVSAIVGAAGLLSTLEAIRAGKVVAIANKEPLVMAGALMLSEAKRCGATILPVDSEHSAVFQCLVGSDARDVARICLTASGGPFRGRSRESLANVTVEEALNHPTWNMGQKITIDSATMMNKALEIIEACWLFDVPAEKIDVLIHPQSIVHSTVTFVDGSVLAQMGEPDMRVPIQYALSYPRRWPGPVKAPDFAALGRLDFETPNADVFSSLHMVYDVCRQGGLMGTVFNAANEVAVARFLAGEIDFLDIFDLIEKALGQTPSGEVDSIDTVLAVDAEIRALI